jgi:phosphatidylserine/phosphatidylglycerophosphate/cardiolipin synthase-like enzyme
MPAPPTPPSQPAPPFNWDDLGRYKQGGRFLDGYPSDVRTFYSPVDDVHSVLVGLLAKWQNDLIGNSIAIGESTKGAISHMKIVIIDGVYTVRGSTNWSLAGEQKQDNELTIHNNAVIAAETRAELDRNHDAMLKQMAAGGSAPAPAPAT